MNELTAQDLYDAREKFCFCSRDELSGFFDETLGDMSPSGKEQIPPESGRQFIEDCAYAIFMNSRLSGYQIAAKEKRTIAHAVVAEGIRDARIRSCRGDTARWKNLGGDTYLEIEEIG